MNIIGHDATVGRSAGCDHFPPQFLGFRGRSTPGRGPQPSISAGVEDFMLSPRFAGLEQSALTLVQSFLKFIGHSQPN